MPRNRHCVVYATAIRAHHKPHAARTFFMTALESVDEAVLAWRRAMEILCNLLPDGVVHVGTRGTCVLTTGVPTAGLNGVFSLSRQPDLDEIDAFAASFSESTLPWSIQIRSEASRDAVAEIARRYGLTRSYPQPFMTRRLEGIELSMPVSGNATVRRISEDEHQTYRRVVTAGFGTHERIFADLTRREVIGEKGMSAYLVEEAGKPVATSFGALMGKCVGVFNISTVPGSRRRGYARMATTAVLQHAHASGARTAFLHSTPAGFRVYESLGFETGETWQVFVAP
jgi:N-acetylglutamate synthase